jgi:outer membrane protein OmpA-like peptidoglycan-associated protein
MMTLRVVLACALVAGCGWSRGSASKANAPISPDFVANAPRMNIDPSLAASDAMNRISPLDVITFEHDSAQLSEEGIAQIDRAAVWLERHPRFRIVLEGHTDGIGDDFYNEDLASRRMHIVREQLMAAGVANDRIVLIAYGSAAASDPNNPEERRVVMFASDQPVRDVVATQLEHRSALLAAWVEQGAVLTLRSGDGEPTGIISRR